MNKVRIGEIATLRPKLPLGVGENASDPVAFAAMADIGEDGRVQNIQERKLEEVKKGFTYFSKGDVLLAKITPCMENGKAAYINELPHDHGFGSTEFHVIRPGDQIDGKYLFYALWNAEFRAIAKNNMKGAVGQKRLPASYIEDHEVLLPPLPEQKRIAAILDKADAIRRKRQKTLTLTESLIQSTFLDMFGDPVTNPKGWEMKPLGDVAERVTVGHVGGVSKWYVEDGIPMYRTGNIGKYALKKENLLNIDPTFHEKLVKSQTRDGDLLVTRHVTDEIKCAILKPEDSPANCLNILLVRPGELMESHYLASLLTSAASQRQLLRRKVGTAQAVINTTELKKWNIGVPPLTLQTEFQRVVKKIVRVDERISGSIKESDNLFNSLQQRAFRGELSLN